MADDAEPTPAPSPLDRLGLDDDTRREWRQLAAGAAEPASIDTWLTRYQESHAERPAAQAVLGRMARHPVWRRRLLLTIGNSPFLGQVALRWPEFLDELWDQGLCDRFEATGPRLLDDLRQAGSREAAARLLRVFKHREFLRLGMADLAGEAPLLRITLGLSRIAEWCLEGGIRWLDQWLTQRHGRPMVQGADGLTPARFVVLGMGKLGGRELNFSSDIDLIYLYDSDEGHTDGPRPLSIKEYYSTLGRELAKLMQEATGEGFVFRTDLRLRPEGESGDLALSVRSAEIYYESWGQSWERAAMIKARPVAGDLALGDRFLAWIKPFVYRRYLDFAALDDLREMKRRIDHKVATAAPQGRNVKLGQGGIREIEFFVQSQQLIHGGKEPRLQGRETLPALRQLARLGFVQPDTAATLEEAYLFLRTVEHRLQIVHERQTHALPADPTGVARLAKRLGLATMEAFQERFQQVTERVEQHFQALFAPVAEERAEDPLITRILACHPEQPQCAELLRQAGCLHPERAADLLRLLRHGPRGLGITQAIRRWYDRLAQPLLREVLAAPDPDLALQHTEAFLQRLGTRANYLALLVENPLVLKLLIRLFGAAPALARHLNHHPQLMDRLVARDFISHYRSRSDLHQDLTSQLAAAAGQEERMNLMREFKNTEVLRLGLRDLSGLADLAEVMAGLSALADILLTRVMIDALQELEERYGQPHYTDAQGKRQRAQFAILAMGKLGGGELNYSSDLDLIFIHSSQGEEEWTDGAPSGLSNQQFFARLGQRIISGITTLTQAGKLYDLDVRLRPSGHSGALVTSLVSFRQYHAEEAWTWEQQALTRARVVVGDAPLTTAIKEEIRAILTRPRDPAVVRQEVDEMRQRLARDKGPPPGVLDLKQSRGGIIDVEFLIQYLILAHAARHPALASRRNAAEGLLAARQADLLSAAEYEILDEAYQFYRLVENRLRLLHDRSENRLAADPLERQRLGRLCNLPPGEEISQALQSRFAAVAPIYQRLLLGNA